MKYSAIFALIFLSAAACKVDGGDDGPPPLPALKTKIIDRMGRPAVNTALNDVLLDTTQKGLARDSYNRAVPEAWSVFQEVIARNLAVYDALDTNCGNQLLAGASAVAGRYDALAGVLADDRLFLNTATGTCETYFGVELGVADDCGGRTLGYDVIDVTYSALAIGAVSGVVDGVNADEESNSPDKFPFFAAP